MNAMVEAHWAVDASHVGWAVADMEGRLVAHAPCDVSIAGNHTQDACQGVLLELTYTNWWGPGFST